MWVKLWVYMHMDSALSINYRKLWARKFGTINHCLKCFDLGIL